MKKQAEEKKKISIKVTNKELFLLCCFLYGFRMKDKNSVRPVFKISEKLDALYYGDFIGVLEQVDTELFEKYKKSLKRVINKYSKELPNDRSSIQNFSILIKALSDNIKYSEKKFKKDQTK